MDRIAGGSIAAIATPPGAGAIAVVRVSGPDAVLIGAKVFRGSVDIAIAAGYTVHYGHVVNQSGEELDEVLVTVFRGPHSFTGEDMVEISCHGSVLVTRTVMEAVIAAGARPAGPGEFTRKAFLNGRIDLSQAEAVADLIAAQSRRGQSVSLGHLEGRLGNSVRGLRKEVLDLCALLELNLDFAEEGLDVISPSALMDRITSLRSRIASLVSSYAHGRIYRDGVSVVLAGEPNAGKSSLFNALLKQDRAIVTPVPGTTRDALEESIVINGVLFRLTDTAGLRDTVDHVERLGVERTRAAVTGADIVLHVMDAGVSSSVREHLDRMVVHSEGQHLLPVLNKCDLLPLWPEPGVRANLKQGGTSVVLVSAKTGEGLEDLRTALSELILGDASPGTEDICITNERHKACLEQALRNLDGGIASIENGASQEYAAFDIREAASALAEITGEFTSEEVLNHIFSRFCIGK
ncbi:MAG TPA: tRNA uridine-5-carboxymethylaminomethyl(34) synthesis GTPase MnmE [Bacteroidota bacterium]|nr:tRNA uridine-5-carboxymethylaminomethyl(34) synthesis GTPase MnmE [Bacteroidota bacterium]